MAAPLFQFFVKDAGTIRDDWTRTYKNGLVQRGVSGPNVGPGSDSYVMAQAFGNELSVAMSNCQIAMDALMADTCTGADEDRLAKGLGLTRRSAASSQGPGTFSSSISSLVATGAQLLDPAGLRYAVAIGGTYANGATIPVVSVDTGAATNLAASTALTWQSAPPGSATTMLVGTGGLTNGADAEDDETFRQRIFARMQNFPSSGNWQYVLSLAQASSPSVQYAGVYPAIQGPATFHVAVFAAPTTTNKNRDVASATVTGTVTPYIQGQMPEHAFSVITTVTNVTTNVVAGVSLPSSPTANPPGPGGGWLDGSPWPNTAAMASSTTPVSVTAVASTTQFTVNAITAPTAGVTHIAWLSPSTWTLYTGLVTAVSGGSGAYVITVDTPFVGIVNGSYLMPNSQNLATYIAAALQAYSLMGPGEKSTNASALLRGFRHPVPNNSWQYSIGPTFLRALTNAGTEVADAQFYYRSDGTTTLSTNGGLLTPQVPGAVTSAPNIYVPNNIALYPI